MRELGFELRSLGDAGIPLQREEETIEAFDTFPLNALAKARWFLRFSAGSPVLADDSGLEVEALGGLPGVRSKRWSGRDDLEGRALDEANNALLLHELAACSPAHPAMGFAARYVCAAACVWNGGEIVVQGETGGSILPEARGDSGFGYDRYFYSRELGATFGEIDGDTKGRISHRGRAFRLLANRLGEEAEFRGRGG